MDQDMVAICVFIVGVYLVFGFLLSIIRHSLSAAGPGGSHPPYR